jgi:UDP-N-acetylmuramoylalanine--D-glutamate ligase
MNKEDYLVLGLENPYLDDIKNHPAQKDYFEKGHLPDSFKAKFTFKNAKVVGEHNEANFYSAYKVLERLKIESLDHLFQEFINEFPGVAHRLEYVLNFEGLAIYNDAKSTNVQATITAIKAFQESKEPLYLIMGGKLRNESDRFLPDLLPFKDQIAHIFTMGEVTKRLADELGKDFKVTEGADLKSILEMIKSKNLKGNIVFSPAFPSFDQFQNYVDRGDKFKLWSREAFQTEGSI